MGPLWLLCGRVYVWLCPPSQALSSLGLPKASDAEGISFSTSKVNVSSSALRRL